MKIKLLNLVIILLLSLAGFSQNNIQFNINHKLADADFAMNTATNNNLENLFNVTRLEYYISEIAITHDGGNETTISDLWILVNAEESTQVDLGSFAVNEVEKISFYIGVDEGHNHLDPSSFDASHPLAPKFPSMHWGWSSGYRFVAFEGNGSTHLNQIIQLHGLGDNNYFKIELDMNSTVIDNQVTINLDADYTRALENINIESGLIVHSTTLEAQQMIENFRDFVFSPSSETTAVIDFSEVNRFEVFPNPTTNGRAIVSMDAAENFVYQISVTDLLGRQVAHLNHLSSNVDVELDLSDSGFYLVNLIKEGEAIISKKLIVQ